MHRDDAIWRMVCEHQCAATCAILVPHHASAQMKKLIGWKRRSSRKARAARFVTRLRSWLDPWRRGLRRGRRERRVQPTVWAVCQIRPPRERRGRRLWARGPAQEVGLVLRRIEVVPRFSPQREIHARALLGPDPGLQFVHRSSEAIALCSLNHQTVTQTVEVLHEGLLHAVTSACSASVQVVTMH